MSTAVPSARRKHAAQWVVVSTRALLISVLCLVGAGCGLDGPGSGVRAVEASDAPGVPGAVGGASEAATALGDDGASGPGSARPPGDRLGDGDGFEAGGAMMPATVAVVGDSLTLSAYDEIEAELSGLGLRVTAIDGVESRRMVRGGSEPPPGTDAIEAILADGQAPDLWIIALGTNDVGAQASTSEFRDDVATILRLIPAGAPVIWVDLWIRDLSDDVVEANDLIRSVVAVRPHTEVVDWFTHGDDEGVITGDGVHLTDAGRERFATSMADAVDAMFEH